MLLLINFSGKMYIKDRLLGDFIVKVIISHSNSTMKCQADYQVIVSSGLQHYLLFVHAGINS